MWGKYNLFWPTKKFWRVPPPKSSILGPYWDFWTFFRHPEISAKSEIFQKWKIFWKFFFKNFVLSQGFKDLFEVSKMRLWYIWETQILFINKAKSYLRYIIWYTIYDQCSSYNIHLSTHSLDRTLGFLSLHHEFDPNNRPYQGGKWKLVLRKP